MVSTEVRPVGGDQWQIVAWLWQCFKHDLAAMVSGLPYPDGRYQTRELPTGPTDDVAGYLAWRPHPKIAEPSPVGFALVRGITEDRRRLTSMWVSPVLREEGIGRRLALTAFGEHPGPWSVAFQSNNPIAGPFWRRVAAEAFGADAWRETVHAVPQAPGVFDHWIETLDGPLT